jgi:hypothetical protein
VIHAATRSKPDRRPRRGCSIARQARRLDAPEKHEARRPPLEECRQSRPRLGVPVAPLDGPAGRVDPLEPLSAVEDRAYARAEVLDLLVSQVADDLYRRPLLRRRPRAPEPLVQAGKHPVQDRGQAPQLPARVGEKGSGIGYRRCRHRPDNSRNPRGRPGRGCEACVREQRPDEDQQQRLPRHRVSLLVWTDAAGGWRRRSSATSESMRSCSSGTAGSHGQQYGWPRYGARPQSGVAHRRGWRFGDGLRLVFMAG